MTNRQSIRERQKRRKRQKRMTTMLIIAGAALILAAILMMPTIRDAVTPVVEFVQPEINVRPMAQANAMGDPNAPVVIEEYSDFGCGHCGTFAQEAGEDIAATYVASGQVYFVYNSAGNILGHPNTPIAAEAAYCAGDQNNFWEFHDIIFANQTALFANMNTKIEKTLSAFAGTLGLNVEEFDACMDSGKFTDEVLQDGVEAKQAGMNSTPSFMINGKLVVGNLPFEQFQTEIEAALAAAGN
jgi:protein-disulfide isomerase